MLDQSRAAVSGPVLGNSPCGAHAWERSNGCCRRYGPKPHSAKSLEPGFPDPGSPHRLSPATLRPERCLLQLRPSEWLPRRKSLGLTCLSIPGSSSTLLLVLHHRSGHADQVQPTCACNCRLAACRLASPDGDSGTVSNTWPAPASGKAAGSFVCSRMLCFAVV